MKIPFFEGKTEIDHCDPVANYFENGQHYIGADFVKEDGTIDYEKYFQARKIESSPCDPLNKPGKDEPALQPNLGPSTKPGTGKPAENKIAPGNPAEPRNQPKPVEPPG